LISGIILKPIKGDNHTLSRKFNLGEKGLINLELDCGWKKAAISCGKIEIADLEQNNGAISTHRLTKTHQFSNFGVELDAGKYQITLFNTQEDSLLSAIFKTNQGC